MRGSGRVQTQTRIVVVVVVVLQDRYEADVEDTAGVQRRDRVLVCARPRRFHPRAYYVGPMTACLSRHVAAQTMSITAVDAVHTLRPAYDPAARRESGEYIFRVGWEMQRASAHRDPGYGE